MSLVYAEVVKSTKNVVYLEYNDKLYHETGRKLYHEV